jgi:hypothetical protein
LIFKLTVSLENAPFNSLFPSLLHGKLGSGGAAFSTPTVKHNFLVLFWLLEPICVPERVRSLFQSLWKDGQRNVDSRGNRTLLDLVYFSDVNDETVLGPASDVLFPPVKISARVLRPVVLSRVSAAHM